jgi:hypothetical protein
MLEKNKRLKVIEIENENLHSELLIRNGSSNEPSSPIGVGLSKIQK